MIEKWNGELHSLVGFENNRQDGEGLQFNFVLSNGVSSTQRYAMFSTDHTHMMPDDALNKIRRVTIHYIISDFILGFSFFDKDGTLLW